MKGTPMQYTLTLIIATFLAVTASATEVMPLSAETPPQREARMQWWREARFGLFIHWGPVSLTEKEISWSRANSNPKCPNHGPTPVAVYDHLYEKFNPTNFKAQEWVDLAKASGVKYMVLTAKHCDGFLLWDSQVDHYNIVHSPFKRDVCAELAKAAHAAGMRIGWYFSPMDWRDSDFRTERNAVFIQRMQGEISELLSHYGTIDLLWFDYDGREAMYDQATTYPLVKKHQPKILLTNRLDLNPGNRNTQMLSPFADYYTPEQNIGAYDDQRPWESCMTISQHGQWAWGGHSDGVKSLAQCLNMLIRCAGGDGNVLLNVGPTPTGEIAPEQAERLKEIGAWLAKYGESIYDTRGGPFKPGSYGASTRQGNRIYLHVQHWPGESLKLPSIPAKIIRCTALSSGHPTCQQTDDALEISLPAADRNELDSIIVLELDRAASEIAPVAVSAAPSLATGRKATVSNVYRNDPQFSADKACDGNRETRWATDTGTKSAWLEVDLGAPTTFSRAVVEQAYPELKRCRKFAIEYWQDELWKPCYTGENLGATLDVTFAPRTAQRVRLNITEASDGPTICEFELFAPKDKKGK
jgi:alpha-L-fucosidase